MIQKNRILKRHCGSCTKCCEGWLVGDAYGFSFGNGLSCTFFNKGCSIYPNHPQHPCKEFECQWISDISLPEWLKPEISGVIITKKGLEIFDYLMVIPAENKLNEKVYQWADEYTKANIRNHVVIGDGKKFIVYSQHQYFKKMALEYWNKDK